MTFAPWFGSAVAVGVFIIGVKIVARLCARVATSQGASQEIRRRNAARELYNRECARGHAHG